MRHSSAWPPASSPGDTSHDFVRNSKKGDKSVGGAPQRCGATNQAENCQVAVMMLYAGPAGHPFSGHQLYLPKRWADDPGRCRGGDGRDLGPGRQVRRRLHPFQGRLRHPERHAPVGRRRRPPNAASHRKIAKALESALTSY
ncbi:transposase [Actinophytocola sp.]|uniref:transposase n=1 Tax=Actinophytocola sp. TaxID=1872138 RepID=UPI00389AC774